MPYPVSKQEFLRRLHEVHGGRVTIDPHTVITKLIAKYWVTCGKHGDWAAWGHHLLAGKGCPECAREGPGILFWEKVRERQMDKRFDLSTIEFKTTRGKIRPICLTHGPFETRADTFLRTGGCPTCSRERWAQERAQKKKPA